MIFNLLDLLASFKDGGVGGWGGGGGGAGEAPRTTTFFYSAKLCTYPRVLDNLTFPSFCCCLFQQNHNCEIINFPWWTLRVTLHAYWSLKNVLSAEAENLIWIQLMLIQYYLILKHDPTRNTYLISLESNI